MVKVRMNTADVAAEVKCLRRLIGMRCSNVYDLSPKTYVFKLMSSSGVTESGESEKVLLLLESGVRLHTTVYMRDKSNTPSGFTLKLRRHIRTRRLEDVRQLGYDRIILFQFGIGVNAHFIILELYAQGNIILTDFEFTVLTLLRSHRDDNKGISIMSRHRYPVELSRVFERATREKLCRAIESSVSGNSDENHSNSESGNSISCASNGSLPIQKDFKRSGEKSNDNIRSKNKTLKVVLGEALGYGPALSEHIILDAGLIPITKLHKDVKLDDEFIKVLTNSITRFEDWLAEVISGDKIPKGYILTTSKISGKNNDIALYDEFCPLLLNQFKSRDCIEFETFDSALDEFYSKIESQRAELQKKTKENSAMQKLDKIKFDQESRVHALKRDVEQSVRMAELIEYNLEDVDAAILAVRVALANGMSWADLIRMVKEEKKAGNPVASLIDKLHLERNCMTLLLGNNLDEMDDDERTQPVNKVEIDLALSAHANARRYYDMKKRQESKQEKTITAHEKAFKAAEKKTLQQLSQEKVIATISHIRKVHWFEKFNWFISSENYLVISGRDAQQNEIIVKRYMTKGDLYVHADLHGASSTLIRNHNPETPIPPLTLNQAGCFTVCQSQAWDSKIVTSAWWVYPHQVSKTAPTGEYLTVGSFMIRGKKNFLPPHPLIMGFGILFRLDESSLGSHLNERRVRGEEEGRDGAETAEPFQKIYVSGFDSQKGSADEHESSGLVTFSTGRTSVEESPSVTSSNDLIVSHLAINSHDVCDELATANDKVAKELPDSYVKTFVDAPDLDDLIDKALELGSAASVPNYELPSSNKIVEEHINVEVKPEMRNKPYISKAERRKLKKSVKNVAEIPPAECVNEAEEVHDIESNTDNDVKMPKPSGGKLQRGHRGKLKKIKEKYADQDEEERIIRIALLSAAGKSKGVGKPEKLSQHKESELVSQHKESDLVSVPSNLSMICYKCKKLGHMSRDCPEHPEETKANAKIDDKATSEMDRITLEEDDINELGDEEKEKLNDLDYLTGNPLPDDVLLYAIPVCGPYNALQSYKYHVKITPGSLKKGRAARTAINLFVHMAEATSREKELMKACTDPELFAAIIGNAKISAAGLTQLKREEKKTKKNDKKSG